MNHVDLIVINLQYGLVYGDDYMKKYILVVLICVIVIFVCILPVYNIFIFEGYQKGYRYNPFYLPIPYKMDINSVEAFPYGFRHLVSEDEFVQSIDEIKKEYEGTPINQWQAGKFGYEIFDKTLGIEEWLAVHSSNSESQMTLTVKYYGTKNAYLVKVSQNYSFAIMNYLINKDTGELLGIYSEIGVDE